MRPLFRSLFLLALFAIPAAHISTGVIWSLFGSVAPSIAGVIDQVLQMTLVRPLGSVGATTVILLVGGLIAVWSYLAASRNAPAERHQTW